LLALFIALPAQAHSTDSPATAAAAQAADVVAGTVVAVLIEDRVSNATFTYRELQLDDGAAVPLQGAAAEDLQDGARVRVTGKRVGTPLEVANVETLAAPPPAPPATAVEVQGALAIAHADDFAAGKSRYIYQVHDDVGQITTLAIAALPRALRGGMRVMVSGQRSDASTLRPAKITILSAPAGGAASTADMLAKAATTSSVLVILANFNNTVAPAYTPAQAQQVMATDTYSVANYYSDTSYGQQLLNVTVTSTWVTMNMAASCDWSTIGSKAEAAAVAANPAYNASNYNFVVYLFPTQSCGWLGLAYVGFPHKAWINGTGAFRTQVISHEMGHNFGLWHAGSLNCGAVAIGGSCSVAEYGDPFDTMGNSHAMHFNARQKSLLSWIPASSVKTHTTGSVNYTLNPIEQPGGLVYAIKIPTASANRTYWLEFRQPIGFDSASNPAANFSWPNNGAQLRVANPFEWTSGSDDTEIVDMTPASGGGFSDAALVAGQSFTDSTYGINVIVTGASASALTVNITTSGGAATTTTLTSSVNPSSVGSNVSFTATVTGVNPTGTVNFKDGATSIAGCSAVAVAGSGNSRTAVCTTNALAAGTHSILASYSGDAANATSSSAALAQTVNKLTSTTALGSSLSPSTAGASVTFTATVSGTSPTGTVNFKDGASSMTGCAAVALTGSGNIRTAICATGSLSVGTHSISAVYGGDATNNGSTSTTFSQVVTKAPSTTTLSSSANPSLAGASVTFTASVSGFAPTGSVSFTDGGSSISGCTAVALAGSGNTRTAQCSTSTLTAAAHSIVANYGGDSNNTTSTSAPLSQVVNNSVSQTTVWVEDAVPAGATTASDGGDAWNWISANPAPYSGTRAHQSALASGEHQHYFYNATATLPVAVGDTLFAYVYLDPANPPSEVMLQWYDGSWEHRAYWGANLIPWGTNGSVSRRSMGALPTTGQWVQLAVPAAQVGLEGRTLSGMAYTLYGGRATWDYAGKTAAGTTTYQITGTVTLSGAALSGVSFAATGVSCTNSDAAGNYACTVPQGWTGTVTPSSSGYTFTPTSRSYSNVAANQTAQNYTATSIAVTVWVDDAVPAGATVTSDGGDAWNWISANPAPFSGARAHQSALANGEHQHYFYNATATLPVAVGDTLFAYVYLDPANPPSEVMLQWYDGSWEHRAYWGANLIPWGTDGTVSRRSMGALPAAGQWVKLAVPAAQVGLEGRTLKGMAFTLYNGRASWDYAGK
jgi:hypothetical protein